MADPTIVPAASSSPAMRAERLVRALHEQHKRLTRQLAADAAQPAWYLHLPGGEAYRVMRIAQDGPFVQVFGTDGETGGAGFVLVSPESVVISVRPSGDGGEAPAAGIVFGPSG